MKRLHLKFFLVVVLTPYRRIRNRNLLHQSGRPMSWRSEYRRSHIAAIPFGRLQRRSSGLSCYCTSSSIRRGRQQHARANTGTWFACRIYRNAITRSYQSRPKRKSRSPFPVDSDLHKAARDGNLGRVQMLLDGGAPIEVRDWESPLHAAARAGKVDIVAHLISRKAAINPGSSSQETPLSVAAAAG